MIDHQDEYDDSDELYCKAFGARDRAVEHGVSHAAAVKAAAGEPPCRCCHGRAAGSGEEAGALTWRKPRTYAECYEHARRCKTRPDAELYHHVLIPFVESLVESVDTGSFEELVWPKEIDASFSKPPDEWLDALGMNARGDDAIDVTVALDWDHLSALEQLATHKRRAGVSLASPDRKTALRNLRSALEDALKNAVDEVRSESESQAHPSERFFTGDFQLNGTNIRGSYGYIHGNSDFRSGMHFVTIDNPKPRKRGTKPPDSA